MTDVIYVIDWQSAHLPMARASGSYPVKAADGILYGLFGCASSAYLAPKIKQLVADFADKWLSDAPAALRLKPGKFQFCITQNRGGHLEDRREPTCNCEITGSRSLQMHQAVDVLKFHA